MHEAVADKSCKTFKLYVFDASETKSEIRFWSYRKTKKLSDKTGLGSWVCKNQINTHSNKLTINYINKQSNKQSIVLTSSFKTLNNVLHFSCLTNFDPGKMKFRYRYLTYKILQSISISNKSCNANIVLFRLKIFF